MTIHRFYAPDIRTDSGCVGLSSDQSRQISRVLRMQSGDELILFDGSGCEFSATLVDESGGRWTARIHTRSRPDREPELDLTVGLSLIRNERFDLAVQKLTELGISAIVPVLAERCVISYKDERTWQKRRSRIERIVIEAAEQAERTTLAAVRNPKTVHEFLTTRAPQTTLALVERRTAQQITDAEPRSREIALLVGPEGGWTENEIQLIEQHATSISLGNLILRSETAVISAAGYLVMRAGSGSESDHE